MQNWTVLLSVACAMGGLACGSSDSDAAGDEFVDACLASSNLGREICECVSKKAAEDLSENAYAFLVASMNEDEDAAAELRSTLDMSEAMAAGMFMTQAPAECASEQAEY